MGKSGSKWLMGCGIGCGVILLLLVVAGTLGFLAIRQRMQSFAEAGSTGSQLERRYGKPTEFTPEAGAIPRERISVFLQVRERAAVARAELETSFRGLSDGIDGARQGRDSIPEIAGLLRRGFGILPKLGQFQAARTRAMLDSGMGPGEYFYIYVVAYYSWLGKSPEDGPSFRLAGQRGMVREEPDHGGDVRRERRAQLLRLVRGNFTAMLGNRHAKAEQGRVEAGPDPWGRMVAAELEALRADPTRIPWQDGLPAVIEESLRPFRSQLEASYSPLVNPLELSVWTTHDNEQGVWWEDRR